MICSYFIEILNYGGLFSSKDKVSPDLCQFNAQFIALSANVSRLLNV